MKKCPECGAEFIKEVTGCTACGYYPGGRSVLCCHLFSSEDGICIHCGYILGGGYRDAG